MDYRKKLFLKADPYKRTERTDRDFLSAVRDQLEFHKTHCEAYARILEKRGFDPSEIKSEADLCRIPPLPTLYLKRNRLFSVPESELAVKATSSGTKGSKSTVGLDKKSLVLGVRMMIRFFSYHKVLSPLPVHYIMLGYEPGPGTEMGAVKTAHGTTKFAPALSRTYCLKKTEQGYEADVRGVCEKLKALSEKHAAVRFVGFPAYMYFVAKQLREEGVKLELNKRSMVLLGGGWKQYAGEEIDREQFYSLLEQVGIPRGCIKEFFSAAEHPAAYIRCKNGHFHIPLYSRVIIRDVSTLEPVPDGAEGLLNFIYPLVSSMPLTSVMTDDIAVLHHDECGCGLSAPYFDLIGRAGVSSITTCAAQSVGDHSGGGK